METTVTTTSTESPKPLALRSLQMDTDELNKNGNGFEAKLLEQEKAVKNDYNALLTADDAINNRK